MVFLIVLLFILLIAGFLLISPLPVKCVFHMDKEKTYLKASIYYPFVKLLGEMTHNRPFMSLYIFNIRVWKKALGGKREKGNAKEWLRAADVSEIEVDASYSLRNPFSTGLASGFIGAALSLVHVDRLEYHPDFFSLHSYIDVEASARLKIGNTLLNFADNNKKSRRQGEWSKA